MTSKDYTITTTPILTFNTGTNIFYISYYDINAEIEEEVKYYYLVKGEPYIESTTIDLFKVYGELVLKEYTELDINTLTEAQIKQLLIQATEDFIELTI